MIGAERELAADMLRASNVPDSDLGWMLDAFADLAQVRRSFARKPMKFRPPAVHDVRVEARVITAMLVEGLRADIAPEHFVDVRYRMLLVAMLELEAAGAPVGFVETADHIATNAERLGEHAFRVSMSFVATTVEHTPPYADADAFRHDISVLRLIRRAG